MRPEDVELADIYCAGIRCVSQFPACRSYSVLPFHPMKRFAAEGIGQSDYGIFRARRLLFPSLPLFFLFGLSYLSTNPSTCCCYVSLHVQATTQTARATNQACSGEHGYEENLGMTSHNLISRFLV